MITKETTGKGFKGLSDYLLHDKNTIKSAERVEWTHTENLSDNDASRAWIEMVTTSRRADELKRETGQALTGQKQEKPVYHLSLSWAKDQDPTREDMIAAGKDALKALGLQEHQALFVCHNDKPQQSHIHMVVNRVHPEKGLMNDDSLTKRKLSAWAMKYEFSQGQILCKRRVENNRALQQGEKPRYKNPVIREAWERSDTGRGFQQALAEKGYVLAQGNKRVVVVDPYGKATNPARELRGVKAADVKARLSDLDTRRLSTVAQVRDTQQDRATQQSRDARDTFTKEAKPAPKKEQARTGGDQKRPDTEKAEHWNREQYEAKFQVGIVEAAIAAEKQRLEAEKGGRKEEKQRGGEGEERGERQPAPRPSPAPTPRRPRGMPVSRPVPTGQEPERRPDKSKSAKTPRPAREEFAEAKARKTQPTRPAAAQEKPARGDSARGHFRPAARDETGANDNERRAELQSRHLDKKIELERRQARDQQRMIEEHRQYYSAAPYRKELQHMETIKRPSEFQKERMEDLRATIADAEKRAAEERDAFAKRCEKESTRLEAKQQRERDGLERELSGLEPERVSVRTPTTERQPQGPPQGRGRERSR